MKGLVTHYAGLAHTCSDESGACANGAKPAWRQEARRTTARLNRKHTASYAPFDWWRVEVKYGRNVIARHSTAHKTVLTDHCTMCAT